MPTDATSYAPGDRVSINGFAGFGIVAEVVGPRALRIAIAATEVTVDVAIVSAQPTPAEIERRTAAIRAAWSDVELERRRVGPTDRVEWSVPTAGIVVGRRLGGD